MQAPDDSPDTDMASGSILYFSWGTGTSPPGYTYTNIVVLRPINGEKAKGRNKEQRKNADSIEARPEESKKKRKANRRLKNI